MIKRNYNLDKLKELSDNNPEFIDEMVAVFLSEIPSDLAQLTAAVESGNRSVVSEFVSKIKPTVELFSIACITEIRMILEWSNSTDPMDVNLYLHRIQKELNLTVTQLEEDF